MFYNKGFTTKVLQQTFATLAFRLKAAFDDQEAECEASGKPIILA
jgi:hypothetical protein